MKHDYALLLASIVISVLLSFCISFFLIMQQGDLNKSLVDSNNQLKSRIDMLEQKLGK